MVFPLCVRLFSVFSGVLFILDFYSFLGVNEDLLLLIFTEGQILHTYMYVYDCAEEIF